MKASDFNIGDTYAAQMEDFNEPDSSLKIPGKIIVFTVLEPSPIAEFLKVKNSEGKIELLHPGLLIRVEPVENLTLV